MLQPVQSHGSRSPHPVLRCTPSLTPHGTGLKDWSEAQIAKAVREGVDRDGRPCQPPMACAFYQNIGDRDMAALIASLRALKPRPAGGKSRRRRTLTG